MKIVLDPIEDETLEANIAFHGRDFIEDLMTEEMGELLVAMNHFKRGRIGIEGVAEEIADVIIVAEQFSRFVGKDLVRKFIDIKIDKLIKARGGGSERSSQGEGNE